MRGVPSLGHGVAARGAREQAAAGIADALRDVVPLSGPARVPVVRGPRSVPATEREPRAVARAPGFVRSGDDTILESYREDVGSAALRSVRSSAWSPEASIDLHRKRTAELADILLEALRGCASRGVRRLLVIHGKGLHSRGGRGVLGDAVMDVLTDGEAASSVLAVRTAPPHLGGAGALVVELDVSRGRRARARGRGG